MTNDNYHIPVLLHDAVEILVQNSAGVYVDVTFGGGGHSREILGRLGQDGKLVAFDQDQDAKNNLINDTRFEFVPQNFSFVKNNLRMLGLYPVDGLLADLGVSSHQFDTAERGFSFRFDADLDMRMDRQAALSAKRVLNEYEEADLARVFWLYGELSNSRKLARVIVQARSQSKIKTVGQFREVIKGLVPEVKQKKFLAQVFQALRIEVNDEMEVLRLLLEQLADVIKAGGRVVFITYHSLEDRMVKNFIKSGNVEGKLEKDFYGNVLRPFKEVNRKPILPDNDEIERNPRSRSAKMRVAERI
ncbi:MAG: 16S rRNA (cytosine(1402)-N(4))-methyltransferase RsmH [Flavobacteriales bacterium]|nr:16S rRNA (cytosine(1402)-N(4))-methyltransferase RsmH [Flavobacteriales bacterium]